MLQPGTYNARPVDAALGMTKGGNEQIGVEFEVIDPEFAGQRITWFGYFTDKALNRTIEALRYCGWQGDDLSNLSSIFASEATVQIVVEHEEYQGEWSARVKWVNRAGGVAVRDKMSESDAKSFAARMKSRVAGASVGKGAASPQSAPRGATTQPQRGAAPQGGNPIVDDDPLPF